MTGGRKLSSHDPTAERTADQSTQTAGGLHQGVEGMTHGPGPEVPSEAEADDVLNRNDEDLYDTPRRDEESDTRTAPPSKDTPKKNS